MSSKAKHDATSAATGSALSSAIVPIGDRVMFNRRFPIGDRVNGSGDGAICEMSASWLPRLAVAFIHERIFTRSRDPFGRSPDRTSHFTPHPITRSHDRTMIGSIILATMVIVVATAIVAPSFRAASVDWSQWRGPERDGVAAVVSPRDWPEKLRRVWRVEVGIGHSSPVVSGDRVFIFSRRGEQEALAALSLSTGQTQREQLYDAPYEMNPAARGHGKGPKSTPVVSGTTVCTFGIGGVLSCYDTQKLAVRWRKPFSELKAASPEFGVAMSPIVEGGAVIAHVGGKGNGVLRAFDLMTGATRWSWDGDGPAYASPVVAALAGVRQLITQTQRSIVGIDAKTGALLWRVPFTTAYDQNAVTPVVYRDLVIVSGLDQPLQALRPVRKGSAWETQTVWENKTVPMYMSSPVLAGGMLFGLSHRNRGQYFAVDAVSGTTKWTGEPRQGENAAVVSAGDVLLGLNTNGELVVVRRRAAAFEVIRRYPVAESPTWAHPAVIGAGGQMRILIKDETALAMWSTS